MLSNNMYVDMEEKIWKIIDGWRTKGITISDSLRSVLYLLTLKKMFKESIGNVSEEDSQTIIKYLSPMFLGAEVEDYNELLVNSGKLIEERYGLQAGFFSNFFADMSNLEPWKETLNVSIKKIMDMPDAEEDVISDVIKKIMLKVFLPEFRMASVISSSSVAELLKVIVNVQDGDKFCDGTVGCGISAVECVRGTDASIQGMDSKIFVLQIAALYMILSGIKKFKLKVGDFTLEPSMRKYSKIAMDIPFAAKTGDYIGEQLAICDKWLNGAQGKDLDVLIVAKALDVLEEEGRAALTVPNSFLSRSGKASKILREKIIEKNMLKAVISLPAVHSEPSVRSSILLLEKNDDKIQFIDMDSIQMPSFQKNRREVRSLTPDGKKKLLYLLETGEQIKGISALVEVQKVKENEFDFSPIKYVAVKEKLVFRDIQTINNDLKVLREELEEIESENSKMKLFN